MALRITVIGAGPGGYTAAFDAAKRGAEVTLVESRWLGGTCLNCGCIPTKTLKSSAEALETVHRAKEFGILCEGTPSVDMPSVIARKRKVSETLRGGLEKTCRKLKVKVVMGRGRVVSAKLVQATLADGTVQDIEGDRVIIATGSDVLNLPSLPVDGKYILSSNEALELDHVPARLVIVGGGVVGTELAFIFRAFGSEVTIVEGQNRLLPVPSVDEEMSKLLLREAKKKGIKVELCRTVNSTKVEGGKVYADLGPSPFLAPELVPASAKKPATLEADCIFMTIGRVPVTDGLGLAEAGVATDKRGYITVNDYLETSVPGIYAIGDILGPARIMLAHMASAEAHAAVANIFGASEKPNYNVVPSGIFSSPEIGDVGLTEAQAKEKGFDVVTSEFQFRELGKAQAMGELPGVFKLVADKASGKLLGAHFAGAHATDLIAECALALETGAKVADIARTIHAHPTLAEGVMEAAAGIAE
ncbi:dihydrolipoyl dehydrogenase [Mailhella massiliensis]|uniref:Dihydrolipoyl dehydrogenase n=1 Tax=Mailhella massiliensis TaxID=1903261 RepID=A0A921DRN1_9BACT|nr:dihydrolipoyl dehydrogenase [Mailhella massiliensis]HJD97221.1 dihydrolipoyl dehydrogenase [Mailhella massiliensis]